MCFSDNDSELNYLTSPEIFGFQAAIFICIINFSLPPLDLFLIFCYYISQ